MEGGSQVEVEVKVKIEDEVEDYYWSATRTN